MIYCLDTNIFVDVIRGNPEIVSKFEKIKDSELYMAPITFAELCKGAYLSRQQQNNIQLIKNLTRSIPLLSFNENAGEIYGALFSTLKKQGKQTEDLDLMIASIALAHNATLITRNGKHFSNIPQLKLLVW